MVFATTTTPRIPRVWQDDNLVHHPAEQRRSWKLEGLDEGGGDFLSVVKGSEEIHCQALRLRGEGAGLRASRHTDEHEQPGQCAEGAHDQFDTTEAIP